MTLKEVQNYFEKLCHHPNFDGDIKELCPDLSDELINHLENQSIAKKKVYPRLVYENIYNVCRASMPYTFEFLGEDKVREIIYQFYQNHKVKTHYYRIIPLEFLDFIKKFKPDPFNLHPYLIELADYEVLEFDLIYRKNNQSLIISNPDILLEKAQIILNPMLELREYAYPVHRISKNNLFHKLEKSKSYLSMYRNPKNQEVYTLVLQKEEFDFLNLIKEYPQDNFSQLNERFLTKRQTLEIEDSLKTLQKMLGESIIEALV
jgi:hypothetical protein